jgi:hypothetical protein
MRRTNSPKILTSARVGCAGIALIAMQACANDSPTELVKSSQSAVMPLNTVIESEQSGIQVPQRMVIRDEATWETVWAELEGPSTNAMPIPQIDFTRNMILVATLGTKPTAGYTVSLGPTYETDTQVTTYVQKTSPGKKCGTAEMVTHPFSAASLPRSDLVVKFVETEEVKDCG